MPSLEERIKKEREKLDQLIQQQKGKEAREIDKQRKLDDRRKYIVGGDFLKIFPQFKSLQPKRKRAEEYIEFAPLAYFLICLSEKKDWVAQLEKEAAARIAADKQLEAQQEKALCNADLSNVT